MNAPSAQPASSATTIAARYKEPAEPRLREKRSRVTVSGHEVAVHRSIKLSSLRARDLDVVQRFQFLF